MLHYKVLPKHKSKRSLKKYSHSKLRRDKTFTGIKVYSYTIWNYWYFTSKPKQDGTIAYQYKDAWFLILDKMLGIRYNELIKNEDGN